MGSTCGGGNLGKMAKKLHENYKINILGAIQQGEHGGTNQFLS